MSRTRCATLAISSILLVAAGCADRAEIEPDPTLEPYTMDHTEDLSWVSPEDVHAYRLAGEELVLVDTRPTTSFETRRIEGAVGVPPDRLDEMGALPGDRWVVVYCECSDEAMAIMAAQRARESGLEKVAILDGGIGAWEEADYPIESGTGS